MVAGTFDRIVEVPGYDLPLVTDLKTGGNLAFSWHAIAVQLAAYSRANAIYVQGSARDGSEDQRLAFPQVDQRWGLILHLNAQTGVMEPWLVDLEAGWRAFETSMWCRGWRTQHPEARLEEVHPADLVDLLTRSVDLVEQAKRRAWLQQRIQLIKHVPTARAYLVNAWPPGLPTLKQYASHSDAQLDMIEDVLDATESAFGLPFPPDPNRPGQQEEAQIVSLFDGVRSSRANHPTNTKGPPAA
jgi:hypothetical protein